MQAVLQRKEEEDRQMQQLVQALQAALDTERQTVRSLKEQVRGQRCHLSIGDGRRLEPRCSSGQEGAAGPCVLRGAGAGVLWGSLGLTQTSGQHVTPCVFKTAARKDGFLGPSPFPRLDQCLPLAPFHAQVFSSVRSASRLPL